MACSDGMRVVVEDATESVFSRNAAELFGAFAGDSYSFFLDGGCDPQKLGRYSVLGSRPEFVLRTRGEDIEVESGVGVERSRGDPLEKLDAFLRENRVEYDGSLPFAGGAVGYLSYDLGWLTEGVESGGLDDAGMLDLEFGFYDKAVVCDNLKERVWIVACGETRGECMEGVGELEGRLCGKPDAAEDEPLLQSDEPEITSNFTKEDYLKAVEGIRDYIRAGDSYQVNLSQRFAVELDVDCLRLYRRLREINPAPFSAYLDFGDTIVLSSSPERFLKVAGGLVETRPIKGTRPRGKDVREDDGLAGELLASEKDRAEHVMIVDLERNDLGKVCEYGSVHVSEFGILESYPTVHHMVSTVRGKLRPDASLTDCVRACFPGGSITGAPKVRAMEIISELEPARRGLYTGSIGYLSYHNTMDLSVVIRTMVCRGGKIFFGVGGGVVYDSSPEGEYQETLDKAKALFQTLGL